MKSFTFSLCAMVFFSCNNQEEQTSNKQFDLLLPEQTGVWFSNDIDDLGEQNIYNTYYIYNGGGVAAGDIDNDGLIDLLFSSNQNGCKLYRNLGNFVFEDITESAGITYSKSWTTGVCMTDINDDGYTDIHICRSGLASDSTKGNLTFINLKDGSFSEVSKQIGLHDEGPSSQIYFFDFDLDDDLDAYVINHPVAFENVYQTLEQLRPAKDSIFSNRFYVNNGGKFVESNALLGLDLDKGFSLSASIGDANNDGYPDIYVANDFISPDMYLINNAGKGFRNVVGETFASTSMLSMGSDMADVNNDGKLDLFVADMEPGTHYRRKNYDMRLDKGFYDLNQRNLVNHQFTRNMLFLNSETGFKEVARMAGVSMTDWSWATLFEDLDNDGNKDLFITNGTKRDIHNVDFTALISDNQRVDWLKKHDLEKFITDMPINLLPNYAFKNLNGTEFENAASAWGLDQAINGQGACIVDLNNDGALDIVVNNSDANASIYANRNTEGNSFFQASFRYKKNNIAGIGTTVELWALGKYQMKNLYLSRGFQSGQSEVIHFGIEKAETVDSICIHWPDGTSQVQYGLTANQHVMIDYEPNHPSKKEIADYPIFHQSTLAQVVHTENDFDEFRRDRIVPFGLSKSGPSLAKGDLNKDGLEDLIMGGSLGFPVQVFMQNTDGTFTISSNPMTETIEKESTAVLTIDLDNDGDLDLYIGNGSNEGWGITEQLQDLVYTNNGNGQFTLARQFSTNILLDTRCLLSVDFNKDGFQDIFIGGGFLPAAYGWTGGSRILFNTGVGFTDVTAEFAPEFLTLQPIYDAEWLDLKGDGTSELITAGHWEAIRRFELNENSLKQTSTIYSSSGLWNCLFFDDLDEDGDLDIIAGNHGINTLFKASSSEPLEVFTADFDDNQTPDPIITHYLQNEKGTFIDKREFCEKMPVFNNRYLTNKQFSETSIDQLISGKDKSQIQHLAVTELETIILLNEGDGHFKKTDLPSKVQFAPVKSIHTFKDDDGNLNILLAGNSNSEFYDQGRLLANHGCVLRWEDGRLASVPASKTGINLRGVVNSGLDISIDGRNHILLGMNNQAVISLEKNKLLEN